MSGGEQVRKLFATYCTKIDDALVAVFENHSSLGMYKHMAYFMGFMNESLALERSYGGKRFRSSLALMLGDWYGAHAGMLDVATSIELFHNFTLIHDDIVDGDDLRRGRKTVWKLFGVDHAINSGDGQLLLSLEVIMQSDQLSSDEKVAAYNFLSDQYGKVVEGQFLDFTLTALPLGSADVTEEAYFNMVGRKTADLIAASTKVAGIVAGLSDDEQEQLFAYGYNLGLAYQLCDDCVSIWGDEGDTGKRPCGDILEQKKTYPVLHAYQHGNDEVQEQLKHVYNKEQVTEEDARSIVALLDGEEVYPHTQALCNEYAKKAKAAAQSLSLDTTHTQTLIEIVDILLPDIKKVD